MSTDRGRGAQTLDVAQIARSYLSRLVTRDKQLSQVPELVESAVTPPRPAGDIATTNVTARLYNAVPTRKCVEQVMQSLRKCVGVGAAGAKNPKSDAQNENANGYGGSLSLRQRSENDGDEPIANDDSFASFESLVGERLVETEANASVDGSDLSALGEQYEARLAPDSDDEGSEEMPLNGQNALTRASDDWSSSEASFDYINSKHLSLRSDSRENGDSVSDSALDVSGPSKRPDSTRTQANSIPSSNNNIFVPALTNVGYISGSGSDSEVDSADGTARPKNNRRGQRARQKIWEQKYGKGAKHLQNATKSNKSKGRDEGWDLKRGARGSRADRGRRKGRGGKGMTGANAEAVVNRLAIRSQSNSDRGARNQSTRSGAAKSGRADGGALHPSWEAKKMAKKTQQTAPFKGTKITFD